MEIANWITIVSSVFTALVTLFALRVTIQNNQKVNTATLNYNRRIEEVNRIKEKAASFINVCETKTDFMLGRVGALCLGREDIFKLHKDLGIFIEQSNFPYTEFYFALPIRKDIDEREIEYVRFVSEKWEILYGLVSDAYNLMELYLNDNLDFHSVINGWLNGDTYALHSPKLIKALKSNTIQNLVRTDTTLRNLFFVQISEEQRHFQLAEETKKFIEYEYAKVRSLYQKELC